MFSQINGSEGFRYARRRMNEIASAPVGSFIAIDPTIDEARKDDCLKSFAGLFESSLRFNIENGWKPEDLMPSA